MDPFLAIILFAAGVSAGIINTLAGGGSFLTIAALLLAGVPVDVANATNRLGVVVQSSMATGQYHRAASLDVSTVRRLLPAAMIGALLGAWLSTEIEVVMLETVVGVMMLVMMAVVVIQPKNWMDSAAAPKHALLQQGVFLLIGLYGGFLQAGVGVFLLMGLALMAGVDLVRANGVKMALVLGYTLPAVLFYAWQGLIFWGLGAVLALGGAVGGWMGVRVVVWGGATVVRWVLVVILGVSGVRLLLW